MTYDLSVFVPFRRSRVEVLPNQLSIEERPGNSILGHSSDAVPNAEFGWQLGWPEKVLQKLLEQELN